MNIAMPAPLQLLVEQVRQKRRQGKAARLVWPDEPEPAPPHWVERPDGRKVLHLFGDPECDECQSFSFKRDPTFRRDHGNVVVPDHPPPEPALVEVIRYLARRAARQWFDEQMYGGGRA